MAKLAKKSKLYPRGKRVHVDSDQLDMLVKEYPSKGGAIQRGKDEKPGAA